MQGIERETRSTDWTQGKGREYSVCLSPGFDAYTDRQREDRWHVWDAVTGQAFRHVPRAAFVPHLISRRQHIEYVRRAACAARADIEAEAFEPLAWLRADIEAGRMPHSTATVTQRTRYAPTVRADGRVQYCTADITATGSMVQLERLYRDYAGHTRGIAALMSAEASGDGRGTIGGIERIPGAVNGTEVRAMPRWTQSRRSLITTKRIERDAHTGQLVEVQAPCDWRCYSVKADGTREPFTIERKTKGKAAPKADARAALAAVAGTLGVEAQGS
jgi:hypothetical protein